MAFDADMRPDEAEVDRLLPKLKSAVAPMLSEDRLDALEIAVAEALTNAIKHARASDPTSEIHLGATVHPDRVMIEIVDAGRQSPADLYDDLTDIGDIDPMQENGRGLSLLAHCADEIEFEPAEGRNLLRLFFMRETGE